MRLLSSIVRTLTTCCSVALLWSASVSPAAAAPAGAHVSACEAHPTTSRKLGRHSRSFGGPLKRRAPLQFGLTDPTARVRRATRAQFDGDDAAIQNDAPAAHLDEDGRPFRRCCSPACYLMRPTSGRAAPHSRHAHLEARRPPPERFASTRRLVRLPT